jgi:hypothetical protein
MVDTWIDKDERTFYLDVLQKGKIEAMNLGELESEFGSLLNTLVTGDAAAKKKAKAELPLVESLLGKLRKARDDENQEKQTQKKEEVEILERAAQRERLAKHEAVMERQSEIEKMSEKELMKEKARLEEVEKSRDKSVAQQASKELNWVENRLWEMSEAARISTADETLISEAPTSYLFEEESEDPDAELEETLLKEKRRLYDILDNGTEEEMLQAEKELQPVLEQLQAIVTSRVVRRHIKRDVEEELESLRSAKEQEEEKEKRALEQEKLKKQKKIDLDEKYLKEAEARYMSAYKGKSYDELIEFSGLQGPMTIEIVTALADMLRKIDNQRITLDRLIDKRERLDKEIMQKSGNKGITDVNAMREAFNVQELSQFFRAEQLDVDSDEYKELESSDEEDMPRTRNVSTKEGADMKVEHAMTYISRLRKSALGGNIKLRENCRKIEKKIDQLTAVQKEIEMLYKEEIKPIKKEFNRKVNDIKRELFLARRERDEFKLLMSKGLKASLSAQAASIEAEIGKVTAAQKLTIVKLQEELDELKKKTAPVPVSDSKRVVELMMENKKLSAQIKSTPAASKDSKELEKKEKKLKKVKEAVKVLEESNKELEERTLLAEAELEVSKEETEAAKQEAERVAMTAQNRYNALVVKNDEDFAQVKRTILDPLLAKNSYLSEEWEKTMKERNHAQDELGKSQKNYKYLENSVKDLLLENENIVWQKAHRKYVKEVAEMEIQTDIAIPPSAKDPADDVDSAAIRFEKDLAGYIDSRDPSFFEQFAPEKGQPLSYEEFKLKFCGPPAYDEDGFLDEEDEDAHQWDYIFYLEEFKTPPTVEEIERATVCSASELLAYRTRKYDMAMSILKREHHKLVKQTSDLNKVQKELKVEKAKYTKATARAPKQIFDYVTLAEKLSELPEEKYKPTKKFFSYPVEQWSEKFRETFTVNKFVFVNIEKLNLEESKDLFTLLTEINRNTGSKSHIWYGNELNRKFNHRDSVSRPKDKSGLIRRAQDTFLEWLHADAALGYMELENDLVTTNSIAYSKLLNSIGNVSVKRSIYTG